MDDRFKIRFYESKQLWALDYVHDVLSHAFNDTETRLSDPELQLFAKSELMHAINAIEAKFNKVRAEEFKNSDHTQISLFADAPTQ